MTQLRINTAGDWLIVNGSDDWLKVNGGSGTPGGSPPAYPTDAMWQSASITSYSPSFHSVTHGLTRQARSRGGHAWQITLYYGAMTRATFAPLWAALNALRGRSGVYSWAPGTSFATQGTGAGSPFVSGAGQTGNSLTTDGWGLSQTVAKAGDFFQIEGDSKVYQLTADVTSDGSGDATMEFIPELRLTPADGADITLSVTFRVALASDLVPVDWNQCVQVIGFTVDLVEVP